MCLPIFIVLLTRPANKVLRDYEAQKKAGLDPVFDAEKCGIEGTYLWKKPRNDNA